MPAMIRTSKKADKIAWSILGKPANLSEKKSEKEKEIDKQLLFQWTQRSR